MELLTYLIKSSTVLALFLGVYMLLLRRDTLFTWNRHFLISGILVSFLLPLWEITQTHIIEIPTPMVASTGDPGIEMESYLLADEVDSLTSSFDTSLLLSFLYLSGTFILFLYMVFQVWNLFQFIQRQPKKSVKGICHVITARNMAPFSFLRYIVYNPKLHSEEELKMILEHETIHIRDRHSYDMILAQILVVFHWFNPLAWGYRKAIRENLEFLADFRTLSKVPCPKTYQLALVRTSSVRKAPLLTNSFYQSFIKKRIVMLNKNQSNRLNALKALAVLPFLALFFYGFNVNTENKYVKVPSPVESEMRLNEGSQTVTLNSISKTTTPFIEKSVKENKAPEISESPDLESRNIGSNAALSNDFEKIINKNTTDSELESIKKELKEKYGLDLSYSRQRNSAGEIVSLSLSYSGNGKSGNYQVTDDKGIEEFTFFITEEGKSGFYSEANERRREERMVEMEERRTQMQEERKARQEEMEARREEMEAQREEMEKQREYRLQEMEVRREDRMRELEDRREAQRIRVAEIHEIAGEEDIVVHRVRKSPKGEIVVVDELGALTLNEIDDTQETIIVRGEEAPLGIITKNTTDAALEKLKKNLAAEGISFSYKNVRRNSDGEIKGIKFTLTDDQGKTTTNVKGKNDDPIEPIMIHH